MVTSRQSRSAIVAAAAFAVTAALASPSSALGQTTISYNSGTYTQNFDTLPSAGSISFDTPGPLDLSAAPISAGGMSGWQLAKIGGTGATWSLIANAGNSTTGGAHSYGVAGETERALGGLASGTNVVGFGAVLVNTGSTTLNSFTINFTMEQWRNGGSGNPNVLSFSYGLGASDIVTGSFTPASSLDAVSVINTAGGGSLNGNLPANRQARSGNVSGINWMPGQTLVIRWNDNDEPGTDSGVAIDDFSFFATTVRSLTWNPAGQGGNNWNTTNQNWLDNGNPSSFMNGDIVSFTDAGVGIVNINGTVEPGLTTFSNSSGMYTTVGASIGGSGALVKTGAGALRLDQSNTFTGGTVVNDGVLLVGFDSALGAPSGGITLGGGTLSSFAAFTSARNVTLTENTTSTINTGASPITLGAVSGSGSLVKRGAATLTFNGSYNVTGATSILGGTLVLAQPSGAVTITPGNSGIAGSDFVGDLVLANGIRLNFNGGTYSGGGTFRVNATGTALATSGSGQHPVISNNIALNNTNQAQPFTTFINSVFGNTLTINGVISGNSDVNFALAATGGGGGIVILNNNNTWNGSTNINNTAGGVVRLGTSNALPQGTALVFGSGSLNVGALDLAGFNQTVASLASDTTGNINGIANTGGSTSVMTIAGSDTTTYAGHIGIPANTAQLPGANANIRLVLAPTHTGQLTLASANDYAGGTVVGGGVLVAGHAQAMGTGSLGVTGGVARLAPMLGAPVTLPAVTVTGGRFDITDNPVVIDYDGASPIGSIRGSIASAYGGGAWTGDGITSSSANASQFGVAYAEASALATVPAIFGDVDSTAVLLRLTRYGDANLDGVVNLADFNRLAANFGSTSAVWTQGDFNYDGLVNLADFNRLAANFGLQAGPDGPTPDDWSSLASAVPEPVTMSLLLASAPLLCRRRRRER